MKNLLQRYEELSNEYGEIEKKIIEEIFRVIKFLKLDGYDKIMADYNIDDFF